MCVIVDMTFPVRSLLFIIFGRSLHCQHMGKREKKVKAGEGLIFIDAIKCLQELTRFMQTFHKLQM